MIVDDEELISLGRRVVARRDLIALQERLGFSAAHMAKTLNISVITYRTWTPFVWLHRRTALRVGRFYAAASKVLEDLQEEGINFKALVPLYRVAPLLGLPHEELLRWYRENRFDAYDLGVLGLWVIRPVQEELKQMAKCIR